MDDADTQQRAAAASLAAQLGPKYEVLDTIGKGGMGSVFKARHQAINRLRAVKILRRELIQQDSQYFERFRREAMIASDLSHSNIVRIFDFDFTADGCPYITMELLEGEDLKQLVNREGGLGLDRTVELLDGVADALDRVHELGVVHRDLKPANLFLTRDETVKILDFGISRIEHSGASLTGVGTVLGTPLYMAPEQLKDQKVTSKSDIYSLAAVAYELIAGRRAVGATNPGGAMVEVLSKTPPPITKYVPEIPRHAEDALARGLAKDPAQRFDSAKEFVRALEGRPLQTDISTEVGRRPDRPKSRIRGALWLLVVAPLVLMGIGGYVLMSDDAPVMGGPATETPVPMPIVVLPPAVALDDVDDAWIDGAVVQLTEDYLKLDPRLMVAKCPSIDVGPESSYARSGVPDEALLESLRRQAQVGSAVGARLAGTAEEQRLGFYLVDVRTGKTIWSGSATGNGFEGPIEEVTWKMGQELLDGVAGPALTPENIADCGSRDETICHLALMAAKAVARRLDPRLQRLGDHLKRHTETAIWGGIAAIVSASVGAPEWPEAASLPPPPELLAGDRQQLWNAIKTYYDGGRKPLPEDPELLESEDDLVRGVASSITSKKMSELDCDTLDTFSDKETCIWSSYITDDNETCIRYYEEFVAGSVAHPVFGLYLALVPMENDVELAERWINRSLLRAGKTDPLAPKAMTRLAMARRDAASAIFWGRQESVPLWREGLARLLEGEFENGVAKLARRTHSDLNEYGDDAPFAVSISIRPVFQPLLLVGGGELAKRWKQNVVPVEHELYTMATRFADALIEDDRKICSTDDPLLAPLAIEVAYFCRQWSKVVELARQRAEEGAAERASRFYVADALLRLGRLDEAEPLFSALERQTTFRAVQPVASLLSLERLGRIAEERGDKEKARVYFSELARIWKNTDIPIIEVDSAKKRLARLGND